MDNLPENLGEIPIFSLPQNQNVLLGSLIFYPNLYFGDHCIKQINIILPIQNKTFLRLTLKLSSVSEGNLIMQRIISIEKL